MISPHVKLGDEVFNDQSIAQGARSMLIPRFKMKDSTHIYLGTKIEMIDELKNSKKNSQKYSINFFKFSKKKSDTEAKRSFAPLAIKHKLKT